MILVINSNKWKSKFHVVSDFILECCSAFSWYIHFSLNQHSTLNAALYTLAPFIALCFKSKNYCLKANDIQVTSDQLAMIACHTSPQDKNQQQLSKCITGLPHQLVTAVTQQAQHVWQVGGTAWSPLTESPPSQSKLETYQPWPSQTAWPSPNWQFLQCYDLQLWVNDKADPATSEFPSFSSPSKPSISLLLCTLGGASTNTKDTWGFTMGYLEFTTF